MVHSWLAEGERVSVTPVLNRLAQRPGQVAPMSPTSAGDNARHDIRPGAKDPSPLKRGPGEIRAPNPRKGLNLHKAKIHRAERPAYYATSGSYARPSFTDGHGLIPTAFRPLETGVFSSALNVRF